MGSKELLRVGQELYEQDPKDPRALVAFNEALKVSTDPLEIFDLRFSIADISLRQRVPIHYTTRFSAFGVERVADLIEEFEQLIGLAYTSLGQACVLFRLAFIYHACQLDDLREKLLRQAADLGLAIAHVDLGVHLYQRSLRDNTSSPELWKEIERHVRQGLGVPDQPMLDNLLERIDRLGPDFFPLDPSRAKLWASMTKESP